MKTTFLCEFAGMLLMSPVFCRIFGFWQGIWYALFHSVSAFCNAGFDLMGVQESFSSLTGFFDNAQIQFTIMILIIIGGIGFVSWDDFRRNGLHLHRYRMQSKLILFMTFLLIFLPALYFIFWNFQIFR